MKNVIKLTSEFLKNELDLPWSAKEDHIVDNSRWSIMHSIIFEHEGKFYRAFYNVGATESQDEGPWEYADIVECTEVEQKEVLVKQWVDKEALNP